MVASRDASASKKVYSILCSQAVTHPSTNRTGERGLGGLVTVTEEVAEEVAEVAGEPLERPGREGWVRVVVHGTTARPPHVIYRKGGAEFARMRAVFEELDREDSILSMDCFSFNPSVTVAGQEEVGRGPGRPAKPALESTTVV